MSCEKDNSASEQFLLDSAKFIKQFDSIAENLFRGEQLENLALDFISKHGSFMQTICFLHSNLHFNEASWTDIVRDDFRLLNSSYPSYADGQQPTNMNRTLAQVYCRASKASYLRATYNKSRRKQEDDRLVPADWARRAIRYDAYNFDVTYWFMIATGWQLDGMADSREKIILSQVFKLSTLRCIELQPRDPLAHHLLGRYYYSVGNLNLLERTLIKALLLQDPNKRFRIEGSHALAEQKIYYAHSLGGDWLPTGLWMARVLLAQKRPLAEVRHWIEFGLALECKEPTTEIEREELLDLKTELKI